jgi:hypothetical protein
MLIFEMLAEQKIQEAIARGELDGLPGAGKPLDLDDPPLVPEDLKVAYRMLKNAGFVPPELELHNEARAIERLIAGMESGPDRVRALRRLQLLKEKLAESRRGGRSAHFAREYYQLVIDRLGQ